MNLKQSFLILVIGTISVGARAQGTVNLLGGGSGPTDCNGVVQVGMNVGYYFSADPAAVPNPGSLPDAFSLFYTGVVKGGSPYLNDGTRSVGAGHLGGDTVAVQVRAWSGAFASFEQAYAFGSLLIGVSKVMVFKLGGADINGNPFPTPSLIVNGTMKSWNVGFDCPEPSTLTLALLGGMLLLFRRRNATR